MVMKTVRAVGHRAQVIAWIPTEIGGLVDGEV